MPKVEILEENIPLNLKIGRLFTFHGTELGESGQFRDAK